MQPPDSQPPPDDSLDSDGNPKPKRTGRDLVRESTYDRQDPQPFRQGSLEGDSFLDKLRPLASVVIVFFVLGVAVSYLLLRPDDPETVSTIAPVENTEPVVVTGVDRMKSLQARGDTSRRALDILSENTIAQGGYEKLQDTVSMIFRGRVEMGQSVYPFRLLGRRPDLYRISYEVGPKQVLVLAHNSEIAWQQLKQASRSIDVSELESEKQIPLRLAAQFDQPLQRFLFADTYITGSGLRLRYIGRQMRENMVFEVLEVEQPGLPDVRCIVDSSSNLVVAMEYRLGAENHRIELTQYRDVDGLYIPHKRDHFVDGERLSTVVLEEVLVNPGALQNVFDPPPELVD
ncbi:MAG: hypothetical protein AAFX93_11720 [Verrucomicrobiota bacterium]